MRWATDASRPTTSRARHVQASASATFGSTDFSMPAPSERTLDSQPPTWNILSGRDGCARSLQGGDSHIRSPSVRARSSARAAPRWSRSAARAWIVSSAALIADSASPPTP